MTAKLVRKIEGSENDWQTAAAAAVEALLPVSLAQVWAQDDVMEEQENCSFVELLVVRMEAAADVM